MIEKATKSVTNKDDIEILEGLCSSVVFSTDLCKQEWVDDLYLSKCENRTCCVLQIKKFVIRIIKQKIQLYNIG